MNVLEFVLLVSAGVVVLAVGIDAGSQIWVEKRAERKEHWMKVREAEKLLFQAVQKRVEARQKAEATIVELNVVTLPQQKKTTSGRHRRLTAA